MQTEKKSGIIIHNLSKRYGKSPQLALKKLSLTVNPGEVYGFLGPNGAGKSTAIRILLNFIQPTDGSAQILGLDIVKDSTKIKQYIGYLSGEFAVYKKMNALKYLRYMSELQPADITYIRELAKRLKADLKKPLGDLSRGNRQKIGLIQALMHKPAVLILDEPTSGLDPLMQEVFYELMEEAKQRGTAIFVSSHVLSEVQKMCDRIGFIRNGKLITEKNIAEMRAHATQTFDIVFASDVPVNDLKKIRGLKIINQKKNRVTIHIHGSLNKLFMLLSKNNVTNIDTHSLDLEEVFLKYYEEGKK